MAEITDIQLANLQEVQSTRQNDLLANPNVVGVGIARKISKGVDTGEHCLSVFVSQKLPPELLPKDALVPRSLDKVKTDVIETGVIFAGDAQGGGAGIAAVAGIEALTARVRPAMGGYSVGHFRITAGTYSTAVYDATAFPGIPRRYYILSNNHVLANSNGATIGDATLQPGTFDGGTAADQIGTLAAFRPIVFTSTATNTMDAAIAQVNGNDVGFGTPTDDGYGAPGTTIFGDANGDGLFDDKTALLGLLVQKFGRTTKLTHGEISGVNATVLIGYSSGPARFVKQIIVSTSGPFIQPGDSGSLLVTDPGRRPVGLLFAANGPGTFSIANRIDLVLKNFGVTIDGQ